MSPHGEQTGAQESTPHLPPSVTLDRPHDVVDLRGIQWKPPSPETLKRRDEDLVKEAKDLVEARIKTGSDMLEFKNQILEQLHELIQTGYGLFEHRQATLLKENTQKRNALEEQLRSLALFDARQQALAELVSGHDVKHLIQKANERQEELQDQMAEMDDADAEVFDARELKPHNIYLDILLQIEKNPGSVDGMRDEQQHLLETRLKYTGSVGGSHDLDVPMDVLLKKTGGVGGSHEVITKMGDPTQESIEARQQMLLEKKWMILRQELQDAEADYAKLGFLQKWFGEKGKMLKMKLARIKADQERVYKQILPARQKKLGTEFEAMTRAMRKE